MQERNTPQKKIVSETLAALGNHPTADQVYAALHEDNPSISRATVYRNLNKLADQGLAKKITGIEGADRFDHTPTPHHHVVCRQCGQVVDIPNDIAQTAQQAVSQLTGFELSGFGVQFEGLCARCKGR